MIIILLSSIIIFLIAVLSFKFLTRQSLQDSQALMNNTLKPIQESLEKFESKIQELEKNRVGAYEGLSQQVKSLLNSQLHLEKETSNLVKALRNPHVRGRWGEIQLKRVVELAGMLEHCDFYQQVSSVTDTHAIVRPDLIIKLPGNKNIVVDAKTPLSSFLDALDYSDDAPEQKQCLVNHSRLIRDHIKKLSQKNYWAQFNPAPEFVILFLPGEHFFSAALEHAPDLIEHGISERVILATPTTLIALLKAVSYGWNQENLAHNAQIMYDLGKELSKRLTDLAGHFDDVGDKLKKTVESYNKTLSSFESRILVTARRFQSLNHMPETEIINPVSIIPTKNKVEELC